MNVHVINTAGILPPAELGGTIAKQYWEQHVSPTEQVTQEIANVYFENAKNYFGIVP